MTEASGQGRLSDMVQTARPRRRRTAAAEPVPEVAPARRGARPVVAVGVVLVVLAVALLARLGAQQRGGPAHTDVSIGDGIPATLYLPAKLHDGQLPVQLLNDLLDRHS